MNGFFILFLSIILPVLRHWIKRSSACSLPSPIIYKWINSEYHRFTVRDQMTFSGVLNIYSHSVVTRLPDHLFTLSDLGVPNKSYPSVAFWWWFPSFSHGLMLPTGLRQGDRARLSSRTHSSLRRLSLFRIPEWVFVTVAWSVVKAKCTRPRWIQIHLSNCACEISGATGRKSGKCWP